MHLQNSNQGKAMTRLGRNNLSRLGWRLATLTAYLKYIVNTQLFKGFLCSSCFWS